MQRQEQTYTPAREALLAAERDRRDARQRTERWSAAVWEERFAACVAEEQQRDLRLAAALVSAPTDPAQIVPAHELLNALEEDVSWYRWFGRMLDALRERWHVTTTVTSELKRELMAHVQLVQARLAEREQRAVLIARALAGASAWPSQGAHTTNTGRRPKGP